MHRTLKELESYKKELDSNRSTVERLKKEEEDPSKIRQWVSEGGRFSR